MTDEVDRAQQETDALLAAGIARAKQPHGLFANGECSYSGCGAAVSLSQLFCNAGCAVEWEKWDKSPALKRPRS